MWLPSALSLSSQTRQTLCEAPHRPRARATPEHKRDPSGRGPARLQCTAPWTPCGTDPACPGGAGGSPQPQAASGPFRPQPGVPMSVLRPHLRLPKRTADPGISERRAAARARPLPQPRRTRSPQTAGRSGSVSETVCPCHHRARAVQLSAAGRGRPPPGEAGGVQGLSRGHQSHLPAVAREPGPRSATVSGRRRPKCTVSPVRSQPPPPPSPPEPTRSPSLLQLGRGFRGGGHGLPLEPHTPAAEAPPETGDLACVPSARPRSPLPSGRPPPSKC